MNQLLVGPKIWREIAALSRRAKRVSAAIAYFGSGGEELIHLKKGDLLVTDASLAAVRAGATNPHVLKRLVTSGVQVCSRARLHAKVVICDSKLIVGSMNASLNSAHFLDEAAVLTSDAKLRLAARSTIESWGSEPLLPEQLTEAIRNYRPPRFKAFGGRRVSKGSAREHSHSAKLWIVGGLTEKEVPERESSRAELESREAAAGFHRRDRTVRGYIHYGHRPKFLARLRRGSWVIEVCDGFVCPPARVMGIRSYPRGKGKRRWLIVVEERRSGDKPWRDFCRAARRSAGLRLPSSRTRAIRREAVADALLSCWSRSTGRPKPQFFSHRR